MTGYSVPQKSENGSRFYLPLVDLLSGVVFVLVIMLMAVAITNRDDFRYSEDAQAARQELEQTRKEIEALRAQELVPRFEAARHERELIRRLAERLGKNGFASTMIDDGRTLRLSIGAMVEVAAVSGLTARGEELVGLVGTWLGEVLPCISPTAKEPAPECGKSDTGRLQRISLVVTKRLGFHAEKARGESILTALAVARAIGRRVPNFVDLRAADGTAAVDYAGVAAAEKTGDDVTLDFAIRLSVPPAPSDRTISPDDLR